MSQLLHLLLYKIRTMSLNLSISQHLLSSSNIYIHHVQTYRNLDLCCLARYGNDSTIVNR